MPADVANLTGLTQSKVIERLRNHGYNEIPSQKRRGLLKIFWEVIREPMLLLLVGSGAIYFFLGETKDALMLLTFVIVVIGITFYQERKTERALEALKDLSSPRALVIREGEQKRIAGREVVIDDLIILREGDRVPADAIVLDPVNLLIDESLLTGESLPVRKDKRSMVYSGTLIIQGHGLAQVKAIGIKTELGKIGKALETIKEEETLLQKETGRLVRNFAIVGIILCFIVIVVYGLMRGHWLSGFLAGLTLSMAMLPEEFSVVLLIFLTLGAWRLSKKNILTRKAAAIETLGSASVLCVDKTGTLTLNRMVLDKLYSEGKFHDVSGKNLPEDFHELVEFSILASQRDPFDPLEKAIKNQGDKLLEGTEHVHHDWKLIREYPLLKNLLSLSHVWESPDKKEYVIAAKGAPEAIFDLCHLDEKEQKDLDMIVHELANQGLRLLGVAKAIFNKTDLPKKQHDFQYEFLGIIGFKDPVRAGVPDAIKECYRAGIRVIMITGDYPGTAQHIARAIGLKSSAQFITGPELLKLDHLQLREKIKTVNIFARVVPEQKLAIVNALKANGEVVAMTGDGVNDAPALKAANIGLGMGERGTDVAREAADLVLLTDDFSSIVGGVKMGRRIFDNLKKAMAYIVAVHVPIAGMSLFPVLFNLPLVLLPAHIAFLELIIDPACSTVFEAEPEEREIMMRPPRLLKEPLLGEKTFIFSAIQGFSVLAIVSGIFIFTLWQGKGEAEARTLAFAVLVVTNLVLILINRSWRHSFLKIIATKNSAVWWVVGGTLIALTLVLYLPFLSQFFHFVYLCPNDLLFVFLATFMTVVWFEGLKLAMR